MAEIMQFASTAGTVLNAVSSITAGEARKASADFTAAQMDQAAGQTRASAQRAMAEEHRQKRLALSTLRARAGGAGSDISLVELAGDIAGEGEYRALTALYQGEEQARGMEMKAAATRKEGKDARLAGYLGAGSTIISKGPGLWEKYGKTTPGAPKAAEKLEWYD